AVILISHDRHLVEACADRLWLVDQGTVKSYDGDMTSYRELLLSRRSTGGVRRSQAGRTETAAPTRADIRRQSAERRAELAPLRRSVQDAENAVERIGRELAGLDAELADHTLYERDPQRAQKLAVERGRLGKELAVAEEKWLAAAEAYEAAERMADAGA
ncbi:MAG: ABC transporter ATP-binding protein, partial [Hyphomicrobiaceae bacterium]